MLNIINNNTWLFYFPKEGNSTPTEYQNNEIEIVVQVQTLTSSSSELLSESELSLDSSFFLGATTEPFLAALAVAGNFFGWELTLLASFCPLRSVIGISVID